MISQQKRHSSSFKSHIRCFYKGRTLLTSKGTSLCGNGYRYCKAIAQSKELVLKVPRTQSGMSHPFLVAIIRDEDEERHHLIFSLYSKVPTTQQLSSVFENIYNKSYSKQ